MKVIIAGSRNVTDKIFVEEGILRLGELLHQPITEIVSGLARGVDTLGLEYGVSHGIPVAKFPALWDKYGKSAGFRRNELMAQHGDVLLAISLDNSRGTAHMIKIMTELKKPVLAYHCTTHQGGYLYLVKIDQINMPGTGKEQAA